jgi:hypothetical protein
MGAMLLELLSQVSQGAHYSQIMEFDFESYSQSDEYARFVEQLGALSEGKNNDGEITLGSGLVRILSEENLSAFLCHRESNPETVNSRAQSKIVVRMSGSANPVAEVFAADPTADIDPVTAKDIAPRKCGEREIPLFQPWYQGDESDLYRIIDHDPSTLWIVFYIGKPSKFFHGFGAADAAETFTHKFSAFSTLESGNTYFLCLIFAEYLKSRKFFDLEEGDRAQMLSSISTILKLPECPPNASWKIAAAISRDYPAFSIEILESLAASSDGIAQLARAALSRIAER